jgi:MMPL family
VTTGGVITAAATIMIVVFGGFVLAPDRMLQMFGLGLASAVTIDAVIIRCLVVPSVLGLLGSALGRRRNWSAALSDNDQPQQILSASAEVMLSTPADGLSVTSATPASMNCCCSEASFGPLPVFTNCTSALTPSEAIFRGYS